MGGKAVPPVRRPRPRGRPRPAAQETALGLDPAVTRVDSAAASGLNTVVGRAAAFVGEDVGIDPTAARGGGSRRRRPGDRARG
jgi:hypothetical protein